MSDTSEELKKHDGGCGEKICRDFVRGICDRKFCKYKHKNEMRSLSFCHDYQNSGCPRPLCKFIHCSTDEVEEYKQTGEMSNQILAEASRKSQLPGIQPVCNLFKKGLCRRQMCKFRHVTKLEEEAEIVELIKNNNKKRPNPDSIINETQFNFLESINNAPRYIIEDDGFLSHLAKRRFISTNVDDLNNISIESRATFPGYCSGNPPPPVLRLDARSIMLEEENNLLHKEIAQLKKQVSDLTATNEFLLDQNATLRLSGKRTLTVTMPTATITNTMTHNTAPQVIRTVAASVSAVPVSIATVTTCNPVSVSPVSIAGCSTVSISPATQILAPSQQILVTTNQPTQLALANSSQAQLAIAQQNLANNIAVAQQHQQQHQHQQAQQQQQQQQQQQSPAQQLTTSQAQQLALAATTTQQLTSQAQHIANQQLALATAPATQQQLALAASNSQQLALANSAAQSHLTSQAQQLGQQLTNQAQQLGQQLTTQAQQLALANSSQAQQQLALASTIASAAVAGSAAGHQQLATSQAQQLALAADGRRQQQLAVAAVAAAANVNHQQQMALAAAGNQQLALSQSLAAAAGHQQQLEQMHHRSAQLNINTSQTIAMSQQQNSQPMVSYPLMTQAMTHTLSH